MKTECDRLTDMCICGHWRLLHKWWPGCFAAHGRGLCVCPLFRHRDEWPWRWFVKQTKRGAKKQ